MRVWLLKDGENLPIQKDVSKMRTWMLAEELVGRGHEVVWWSSTHSHQQKSLLCTNDLDIVLESGIRLVLLNSGSYSKNRSIARYRHHRKLARRFLDKAKSEPPPDIIVASFPTIDFANAGTDAASEIGCAAVIDIRDPWPDVAFNLYRGWKRNVARLLLSGMDRGAKKCLGNADSLIACSDGFLAWGLTKAGRSHRADDQVYYIGRPIAEATTIDVSPSWLNAIGPDKLIVSFVGAFGQVYELELICLAARKFADDGDTRFHFVLAGDGDKGRRVRELTSDLPNVSVPGWIPTGEARALMKRSALGLAPYRQLPGCMPNKIFEYMALGLPVISSLEGDLPKLLDQFHAGYSYQPGDHAGLSECVNNAVQSRQNLESLSTGALRMFRAKFNAAEIYADYATHLERLVAAA